MTKFNDVIGHSTVSVYEIEWMPEDGPMMWVKTYVLGTSMDDACGKISGNPADFRVCNRLGPVLMIAVQPKKEAA